MRCPSCEKFVSLDLGDPEVEDEQVETDGSVTITVRLVRTCAECGEELKEARFELSAQPAQDDLDGHDGAEAKDEADADPSKPAKELTEEEQEAADAAASEVEHDLQIEILNCEPYETAGGRYKKKFFGVEVEFQLTCTCDQHKKDRWSFSDHIKDEVAASGMDELT